MKKIVLLALLAAATGGILFAQTAPAATTVNGTLGFYAGSIVVRSGTTIYYTRGLDRLVGFIDGFKEGAQVTIEGYVSAPRTEGQTERVLFPVKLTLNGKVYDLWPAAAANARMGRPMLPAPPVPPTTWYTPQPRPPARQPAPQGRGRW
ncbi:MAG: hypothetical protein LBU85_05885 [Treponema sp.]|jgi:hypothetical protein|nr:hypothetical protein [Treponema sp.]